MTMRAKVNIEMQVATDTDLNNLLWKKTKESLNALIRDDCNAHNSGVARLSASGGGTPSITIPLGDIVTGYLLYIQADKECTVKLDGGSETQTIKPSGSYPGQLFLHGSFTSAPIVANQSTSDVCTVEYCLVGVAVEP